MQIVIEIPEEKYIKICDESCTELALAVRNGTVLPDNPTNGDMIKAMFPNGTNIFDIDWWNAPYRKDD